MGEEQYEPAPKPLRAEGEQLIAWCQFLGWSTLIFWVLVPPGVEWPVTVIASGYQVLGALLALLGLAAINDWVWPTAVRSHRVWVRFHKRVRAATKSWLVGRRHQIEQAWAWLGRRPPPEHHSGSSSISIRASAHGSGGATGTLTVARPDPASVAVRTWLRRLDDDVVQLQKRADEAERARLEEDEALRRRLAQEADALRREIRDAVRVGWPLVAGGLALSGIGALIGGFA